MKKTMIFLLITLLTSSFAFAGGFYFGGGTGDAALNTDLYIYSSENNSRQPELDIRENSGKSGDVYRVFIGQELFENEFKVLGNELKAVFSLETGYVNLGGYDIDVSYNDEVMDPATGYRYLEETALELSLKAALHFSDISIYTRVGMARLNGTYTEQGLRTARQPEYYGEKQTFETTAVRPVWAVGAELDLLGFVGAYAEYAIINGEEAGNEPERFESSMVECPNELYKTGYFTAGLTLRLF